tara:strand:- start:1051 stop:1767 length:717 start_codon:yes stop_codon:yes gene_type:complete
MIIDMKQKFDKRYRYERKYVIENYNIASIYSFLKLSSYQFSEIYEPRFVNNIYYDYPSMEYYKANVSGIANRLKIRIRWYNHFSEPIINPNLELKIKKGHVGRKETFKLDRFDIKKDFSQLIMYEKLQDLGIPFSICEKFLVLKPVLVNRYKRKYFLSRNKLFRVTIDEGIKYCSVSRFIKSPTNMFTNCFNSILEVKYLVGDDQHANNIGRIISQRVSRNSKYVNGIDMLRINEADF